MSRYITKEKNEYNSGYEKRRKINQKPGIVLPWLRKLLLAGLILFGLTYWALSPFFNIKTVEVSGTVYYNKEIITGMAEMSAGENGFKLLGLNPLNIYALRFSDAEKRIINRCPYVKTAKVRFVLPSTVRIEVTERKPAALVDYLGTKLLIDNEGIVLETLKIDDERKYPEIRGLSFDDYMLGKELKTGNDKMLEFAITVLDAVSQNDSSDERKLMKLIDYVDVSGENYASLYIDGRILAKLGGIHDLHYKISSLKTIYFNNLKENDSGILDFTTGKDTVFSPDVGGLYK